MIWNKSYQDDMKQRIQGRAARYKADAIISRRKLFPSAGQLNLGDASQINAVILFVDIVGFTSRTEDAQPDDLLFTLSVFLSEMAQIVEDWSGTVEKFTGDGLMAIFDAGRSDEVTMVQNAIDCATTMRHAVSGPINSILAASNIPSIEYRIGIDGGKILIGKLGIKSENDHVAIGYPANIACKLQELAPVNGILLGNYIHYRLPDFEKAFCCACVMPPDWRYTFHGTQDQYTAYNYQAIWKETDRPSYALPATFRGSFFGL